MLGDVQLIRSKNFVKHSFNIHWEFSLLLDKQSGSAQHCCIYVVESFSHHISPTSLNMTIGSVFSVECSVRLPNHAPEMTLRVRESLWTVVCLRIHSYLTVWYLHEQRTTSDNNPQNSLRSSKSHTLMVQNLSHQHPSDRAVPLRRTYVHMAQNAVQHWKNWNTSIFWKYCSKRFENQIFTLLSNSIIWKYFSGYGIIL